jgi:undecaprenyl-phosphate galactose phosphotransferase
MQEPLKRAFDLALASVMLVVLSPIIAVVAAAVAVQFRGNPVFAHTRIGRNGRPFKCLKFKTMKEPEAGVDEPFDPTFKNGTSTRTTRVTAWLRRTSLDELPQFVNVLAGQMSIVGPRPIVTQELLMHYGDRAPLLLLVRPGMTGMWTVNGRSDVPYPQRSLIELQYVTRASLWLDTRILARTFWSVVSGKGAL